MKPKNTLSFLLLFFTSFGIAQSRKQIQGLISVPNAGGFKVLILNLNTQQEVQSDSNGIFKIEVNEGDVLLFSSEQLYHMKKIVEQEHLISGFIKIDMISKRVVLDEVEVTNNSKFNAVDLGISQQAAKRYTPAERRLKTAGDFKPIHLLGLLGGSIEVDPIINAINGKTKRLKKEILLEQNQLRFQEFQDFFSKEALVQEVKVHPECTSAFTYFVLENEEFKTLLGKKDRSKLKFYLIQKNLEFENNRKSDEEK